MLNGRDIVCLATQPWDANWTTCQQMMVRLAPENRVLYVEPFRAALAWMRPRNRSLREARRTRAPRLREVRKNLFVYRMGYPYLPFNSTSSVARAVNGLTYRAEVARILKRLNFEKPWLWAFVAQNRSVLTLPFEHVIYDCVDEWSAFGSSSRETRFLTEMDALLCRRAELVFAGSKPLGESKSRLNPRTFVVNHGVDIDLFSKSADPATQVPPDLERIPHPRIGFIGLIDRMRFDVELLRKATENPRYHVVIVGDVAGGLERLENFLPAASNLHLLGLKPVAELPAYLKGLDVCLMPYLLNETTRNIYPLKLHEYMASGKPIVTTAIPAIEGFEDLLLVARNNEEFIGAIGRAVEEKDPGLEKRRRECARLNSWEERRSQKVDLIARVVLPGPPSE
jgi:glycosyltransferase involved in cell wall biosynthesis